MCMIVDSPIQGVAGTEVVWADVATGEPAAPGTEKGKACAESILGLIAHGGATDSVIEVLPQRRRSDRR